MQTILTLHRTRLFINRGITCALLALTAPMAALAQQVVFYDTFGTSSLDQTNIAGGIPGGIPTASQTSYTVASAKTATATSIGSGHLQLITGATSSGNSEIQAIFTKYPVTLATNGDYIELTYTFTDTPNILQSASANTAGLFMGLFNSGGVPPQSGTILANGGLGSATTAYIGGVANWVGYNCNMYNLSTWYLYTRPAQTAANNNNQSLLYNYSSPNGANHNGGTPAASPNLIPGQSYTCQYRITLTAPGTLTISNGLYTGVGTGGALLYSNVWTGVTGANLLTTNFDSLAIGYRAANSVSWTNDINSITVVAGLAAQAGPYFSITNIGDPCSGGVTINLSGSVTTNAYLLYLNGMNSGQAPVTGTGAPISFGLQNTPGVYTIYASNTVTANVGPMYGSVAIAAPGGPVITAQPASVTVVTNVAASFLVAATGTALTYQWYENGVVVTNGGNISGALSTNLVIYPTLAANVGAYYVVVKDPCGYSITSAPNATLTLTPARNLIWAGGNTDNNWEYSELNFTLSGLPTAFTNGDDVTFDDTSANTTVSVTNSLIPTLVTVNTANGYILNGSGKVTGFGRLVDVGYGTLTIANNNDYIGGTVVSNGATLTIGDGTTVNGSVAGTITVSNTGTLNYNYGGAANATINLFHALAGNGTVNFNAVNGATIASMLTAISSNFNGTINIQGYTRLHAGDNNAGCALGNGSTVNVPANTQAWLDRSGTAYNNTFNIAGNGWIGVTIPTGAMSVFGCTVNGPINLQANARIGGSINGGTIQSVISGPYQLEVWGTTNSYVLIMGPTNGSPQAYNSTLITAGSIQAANSNAISRGPLTLDSGGDLRVNGNNITVSNLSSINSGQVLLIEGPRVRNMHATIGGTLTVGSDDTSTEFDGTFSDGAAAAFGLTKVGAGTLTLTAVNTNTGAVTVNGGTLAMSGSFGKASQIIANNSGVYDVTGAGGTLTLNNGQTLRGNNGTVNGILVASAGSAVAPGFPMGTLTVSGNGTISGIYRPNLNRTNTPSNCSQFTSFGGSITFSGATLSVTNVGPKLQVGDFFQLFSGVTAGFSSAALQTNDVPNSANYTWNNTVATDGKITVASVVNRVPILQTALTASAIIYGQTLSSSPLSGGSVTNSAGAAVAGAFAFTTPTNIPSNVGVTNVSVTFTPTDTVNYSSITFTVGVTVNLQTPVLKTAPIASTITNGNPLSVSILTGGVVTNAFSTNVVTGTFAFTTPSLIPGVGAASQSVTFTPTDLTRYNPITLNVSVTVVAAPAAITALKFTAGPVVSGTNLTISVTNTGAGTFYLLNHTNVASARNNWKPLWTNVAAGSSSFTATVTNAVNPALGMQFYILSTTNNQ
jgi:fibronectin-binding autotransporter adhesin